MAWIMRQTIILVITVKHTPRVLIVGRRHCLIHDVVVFTNVFTNKIYKSCIWQLKNAVYGSIFYEYKNA
jgi:hypothetical protein